MEICGEPSTDMAQGNHRAVPMDKGYVNVAQVSHAIEPSSVGDCRTMMIDEVTVSLAHTLFIQW